MKLLALYNSRCRCELCKRTDHFNRIAQKLPPKDAKWIKELFCQMLDLETERDMREAHEAEQRKDQ